jgi:hypothetical protein
MTKIIIFLLTLFISNSLFSDAIARLSKSKIKKGEPLSLEIEIPGGLRVSVQEQVVRSGSVTAEYIGVEENVSIINGKVTQKKKLKYRIVTSKDGKLQTPQIPIVVDGNSERVGSLPFEVSSEKYEPPPSDLDDMDSLFDRFIGRHNKRRKKNVNPSPDDFVVVFHTNRDFVYTGETLVGYYILFYKNLDGFFLERNETKPPEFPFFLTEMLYDVSIETPEESVLDGKTYRVQPYQKEIYALTPLRSGNFKIGNAKFLIIDGGIESSFPQKSIDSRPKSIQVRNLPKPTPENFSGEVGVYSIELIFPHGKSIPLGGTIPFTVKIKGEGVGTLIKEPLSKYCENESCGARFVFLGEKRNRKFVKLAEGNYGFSSELEFQYSIYPRKKGILKLENLDLVYFNPNTAKYETASAEFPNLETTDPPPVVETPLEENSSYVGILATVLLLCSASFIAYQFREDLRKLIQSSLHREWNLSLPFVKTIPEEIKRLDVICGHKKDALLKNFLIQKGFREPLLDDLLVLKSIHNDLSFTEIYEKLDNQQKIETVKKVKELFQQKEIS